MQIIIKSCNYLLGCVELNTDYIGNNIYTKADVLSNTEQLCQKSCQKHPECNWWSLDAYTWNKYGCWLKMKRELNHKQIKPGVTFGPKFCGIHYHKLNISLHHKKNAHFILHLFLNYVLS